MIKSIVKSVTGQIRRCFCLCIAYKNLFPQVGDAVAKDVVGMFYVVATLTEGWGRLVTSSCLPTLPN